MFTGYLDLYGQQIEHAGHAHGAADCTPPAGTCNVHNERLGTPIMAAS